MDIYFIVNIFIYLYKYLFKSSDYTQFTIWEQNVSSEEKPVNEIKDYMAARYLSAIETTWYILSYHIT